MWLECAYDLSSSSQIGNNVDRSVLTVFSFKSTAITPRILSFAECVPSDLKVILSVRLTQSMYSLTGTQYCQTNEVDVILIYHTLLLR